MHVPRVTMRVFFFLQITFTVFYCVSISGFFFLSRTLFVFPAAADNNSRFLLRNDRVLKREINRLIMSNIVCSFACNLFEFYFLDSSREIKFGMISEKFNLNIL